jgi:O-antigen ligase
MLTRILSNLLLALCGAGLLMAWVTDQFIWYIFEALVFGVLIAWAAAWAMGKVRGTWSWLFLPFLAVIAWGVLQLRWSVYAFATETDAIRWGTYLAVFFLAVQLFGDEGSGRMFRRIFTVYALLLAVVSVFQYFLGNGKIYWLFQTQEPAGLGPFLNRDHYASFIALVIPAAAVEMLRSPRQRWFFALTTAVLYASVIAGASRAGFVFLTLEVVLLILILGFSGRTVLAVVSLILVFGFVVGWDSLYERLQAPDPYAGRREVAAATVQMIKSNPWRGFGLGTWTQVYPAYAVKDFGVFVNAAHSDWLQWGADGGIPMTICLLVLFGGACLLVQRVPWALGVPIVFLHGLTDFPMQGRFLPAIVFLVLGIAVRSSLNYKRAESGRPSTGVR